MHAAAATPFEEGVPGREVDERVEVARVDRRLAREVRHLQPRDGFVAVLGVRDAAALAVDEQVVALARGELLDPGEPLPAPRSLGPRCSG